jgi:protein-S-isoprenylcysteine O-methyltransferase Ste14
VIKDEPSRRELIKSALIRVPAGMLFMALILFLPAGTLAYWEAWVYIAGLIIPMVVGFIYLLNKAPELLERRMRMKEKEKKQKKIIRFSYLIYLITFLIPGFDRRFGWSEVPFAMVIFAEILVLFGYGICFFVFRENRYASRIIEVEPEQKVISTGVYSIVRHPMYSGVLLMNLLSPLALGSFWAVIPALMTIPIIVARLRHEEMILVRDLDGYREYRQKTKYRLIPGVW